MRGRLIAAASTSACSSAPGGLPHARRRLHATAAAISTPALSPSGELLPPDLEPTFDGRDGYLRLWRYWLDAFEDIRWDPEEILDLGDKLLVTTQQRGHGSGSGVAVSEQVFQLFTFRRGLVVRQEDFLDHSKALKAAGTD